MLFNTELPLNTLSFGHVSFGILHEFYKRGLSPNLFPIGQPDLSCFDKVGADFHQYVATCSNKAFGNFKRNLPAFKVWHVQNSWHKVSNPAYLLTFHETSELTIQETNILNQLDGIFLTSPYSKMVFENNGVTTPIHLVKLGFDELHYQKTNKKYFEDGSIVFSVFGKAEFVRKAHDKTIRAWIKKYGGNLKYRLHLFITNPFFKNEDMNNLYAQIFNGAKPPVNVTIFPFQVTDSLMNDAYNATDIVLDMSKGESLSLPSLVCLCLGKHGVIHNATGMKGWATPENAVLVESSGKVPSHDGIFFHNGNIFNQGAFFDWNEDEFLVACDKAIDRFKANPINTEGEKLKEQYSYKAGVDTILSVIQK